MTFQPTSTWFLALVLAIVIAGGAYRLRALSPTGVIAAVFMGTIIVGTGGWWPGVILVAFFVSSSLVSRLGSQNNHQARGARRDWVQVLANGWAMLLGGLLFAGTGNELWLLFGIGGVAAAAADTWSSEIGRRSTALPRLITTGSIVPSGTSGAVSGLGLMATVTGAALVGVLAGLAGFGHFPIVVVTIAVAGIIGGLTDSLLGATIQERRFCTTCQLPTESNPHRCGQPSTLVGGIRGINNDTVNSVCVLTGAFITAISGILWL